MSVHKWIQGLDKMCADLSISSTAEKKVNSATDVFTLQAC